MSKKETHFKVVSVWHHFAVIALHPIKHIVPHQSNTSESFTFFLQTKQFAQNFFTVHLSSCGAQQPSKQKKIKNKRKSSVNTSTFGLFRKKRLTKTKVYEHRNERRKWAKTKDEHATGWITHKKIVYSFKEEMPVKNVRQTNERVKIAAKMKARKAEKIVKFSYFLARDLAVFWWCVFFFLHFYFAQSRPWRTQISLISKGIPANTFFILCISFVSLFFILSVVFLFAFFSWPTSNAFRKSFKLLFFFFQYRLWKIARRKINVILLFEKLIILFSISNHEKSCKGFCSKHFFENKHFLITQVECFNPSIQFRFGLSKGISTFYF